MASRFWVGGTGNWDAADTTHWAATSGGAGGQSVPGSGDTVTFDASSGGGTVTVTATQNVTSITGGAHTGTVDFNGQTITIQTLNWSGTGVRSLTLGAAAITVTGASATVWTTATSTNLTLSAASSTITLTGANATFASAGTYGTIISQGSGKTAIGLGTSCATFTRIGTAAKTDTLEIGTGINLTVSGTFTVTSNSDINRVLVYAAIVGTARTITAATVVLTNTVDFQDITGAGAATWTVAGTGATAIGDCGGNSGITFPASVSQTWSGTSGGNWSANAWTTRVPLPQDDVTISSAFSASQTVTADMPRLGRSISWTGATGTPTWSLGSVSTNIYGSLTLISGMTVSGASGFSFGGRSSYTITSSGKTMTGNQGLSCPGGTYTLQDAFNTSGSLSLTIGSLDLNNFSMTSTTMSSSNNNVRSITFGTGTWSLTSTATATVWDFQNANATLSGSNGTIAITGSSANNRTFAGGTSKIYGTLTYTVAGSTGQLNITGSNSFDQINFSDVTNARSLLFTAGTTTTIRNGNGFNVQGTSGKLMTVSSITGATHTLSSTSRQVCSYLNVSYSIASAGLFYAQTTSTDGGNNTNWIFTNAPVLSTGGGSNGIQNRMNLQNLRSLV